MNVSFIALVLTEIISLITNTESVPRWKWTQRPHQNPWLRNPSGQSNDCVRGQCVQSWKCPPQAVSRESSGGCAHWGNRPWVCCIIDYDENIHSRHADYHPHADHHNHPHVNHHDPHDDYHNHPHEDHHNHPHEDHHYGHGDHYDSHEDHYNPHDDHHDPHEEHHHSDNDPACESHFTSTIKPPNPSNNWNYKTTRNVRVSPVTKRTTPNPPNTRTNKPKSTTNPRVRFPSWTQKTTQLTTAKPWGQPIRTTRSSSTRQTTRTVWSGNGGRNPGWANPTRASSTPGRVWTPSTSRTRAPPSKSTVRGRERVTTPLPNVNTYLCGIRQPKPRSDRRIRSYSSEDNTTHIEGSHNISKRQVLQRIVGGEEVEPFTWPWVAALYKVQSSGRNRFLCAGSLVNENFVLTAAHSFTRDDVKSSSYVVMLGTHNAQDAVAQYRVSSVLQHPRYESRLYYHDIALLRLERHVIFNEYVMPVCLPSPGAPLTTDRDLEGKTVTVMGWGDESFGGKSSRVLKEASFKIVSRRACNASYVSVASNRFPRGITNDMLCAGDPNGGKDACQGDSGGPLTSIERGRYTQVGVVSFGYQCGTKDFPGVYTKVAPYLSWIAENSQKARVDHDHDYDHHEDYHDDDHHDDYRS